MAFGHVKRPPRLVISLPQFPWDPASGAARTTASVGEILAETGFSVKVIATTATEGHIPLGEKALQEQNFRLSCGGLLELVRRGVSYTLVNTCEASVGGWAGRYGQLYDDVFENLLGDFRPDFIFTYGGSGADFARHNRAKAMGARVVFGLYNVRYCTPRLFEHVDAIVTPSEFLTTFYRDNIGLLSTPLPTPLSPDDVIARQHDPKYLTIVNPTMDKGMMFFLSLAEALLETNPTIPIQLYASRVDPYFMQEAAHVAGIHLPELMVHSMVPVPSRIYQNSRVLLVPSLVEDAAPRVIAEALANGVPPIGSDRGGIPEMCDGAGFVLPLPRSLDSRRLSKVTRQVVAPWVELIASLFKDESYWSQASARARMAGAKYLTPIVTKPYLNFFTGLLGDKNEASQTS